MREEGLWLDGQRVYEREDSEENEVERERVTILATIESPVTLIIVWNLRIWVKY